MATYTNAIQKLYVAYFNRPADAAGLAYWEGKVTEAGGSTAEVSATFAASDEYEAEYGLFNVTGTLTQIYHNLFGHAPDAAGLAYWVKAVTDGEFTIDKAVTQIALGAQGTDLVAYNNKVTAATAFTAALDTQAEKDGYSGELANEAAKEFLAGITTNASLTAALVPATLAASVGDVIKAGVEFTLIGALGAYNDAVDARTAFLVEADGDDDEDTALDDAGIDLMTDEVEAAIDAAGVTDYDVETSVGVKAAKLADAIEAKALALETAQDTAALAAVAVATVPGLTTAVAVATSADLAEVAAGKAADTAAAKLLGSEATYEAQNAAIVIAVNGTVAGVIVKDGSALVLADDITETTNPGVTALLADIKADLAAKAALTAATSKSNDADFIVAHTAVLDATATTALEAIGTEMGLAAHSKPSPSLLLAEFKARDAAVDAAQKVLDDIADDNGTPTDAQSQALIDAQDAATAFATVLGDFEAAIGANTEATALIAAQVAVVAASEAVDLLDEAVVALADVNAIKAELKGLDAAVAAAAETFEDHDFALPVTLTAITGGTPDADIFVAGEVNSTVHDFASDDILFIGADYTLNLGKPATAGDDKVLEAFAVQSGANVVVTLETKVFGSNSADAEIVITLVGVNVADIVLKDGIITA